VEFAALLPVLILVLVGTWEVGRLVEVHQVLDAAVSEGARQASTGVYSNAQAEQAVIKYLAAAGLPTAHVTATVSNLTHPATDVSEAVQLDQIEVTVSIPFRDVRWSPATLVTSSATELAARTVWCSARAKDYPANVTPPTGY
jgi:Flp pilus assembly protein TadG